MSRRLAAAAAAVLLVVAAGMVLGGFGGGGGTDLPDDPPTTTTTASPESVEATIAELKAFVAERRDLAWKADVAVTLLDDEAFEARLLRDAEEDREETEVDERVLRALGLLDPGVDLYGVLTRFLGDAVVGFYDTEEKVLFVRGGRLSPYVRATLVHELTHAIDDQHFDLDRSELDDGGRDEEALAFAALVEGNALRVEAEYRSTFSTADRTQAGLEEARLAGEIDLEGVPPVIPSIVGFPYTAGPALVRALFDEGGERRIDEAYRTPPLTTEDVIHPDRWLAGERAVEVPRPEAEGEVLDEGVYGQSTLALTLEPVVGSDDAAEAAEGWGGDAYVAWSAGDQACLRATFVMDTERDLDQLTGELRTWAAERGARVDRQPDRVSFTSCG